MQGFSLSDVDVQKKQLNVQGSKVILYALVIFVSILFSFLIVGNQGNLFWAVATLGALIIAVITFYRLDWGYYVLIGMVLFSDRFPILSFRPFTYTIFYLTTINTINPGIGVGVLTSNEIHVIFLIAVWIIVAAVTKRITIAPVPFKKISIACLLWIIWSVVYGRLQGGDMQMAFWEIRALPLLFIMFWFTPQIIRTKKQIVEMLWVVLIIMTFKALQGVGRFIDLDFTFGGFRALTNSEDPVFFITLFLLLFGVLIFRDYSSQRRGLIWFFIPLLMGFYLGNRRATYASFGVSIIAYWILLPAEHKKRLAKHLIVFSIIFAVYLAAYWNSYGRLAVVANAVRTTLFAYDKKEAGEDYSSGLAREQENYNLAVTFRRAPILGIGFGQQHDWVIRNYGAFALKGYITHNQILWFLIKSGAIGYFLLFLFLNGMVMYGAYVFKKLKDPYLQAVCAMCIVAILNQLVTAHVEQQLINSRCMTYLGLLMGLIGVVESIHTRDEFTNASKFKTDEQIFD
jgi:hypothetical protein